MVAANPYRIDTEENYDYGNAIRNRLSMIDDIGYSASNIAAQRSAYQQQMQQANEANQFASAANKGAGAATAMGNTGGGFGNFMKAISAQESGGNYGALNPSSGAMGKYQIMPSNILGTGRGWDYEVLGKDINTAQFLNSPEIQEQIATAKLKQYYNAYGPAGAAIAWYAGPGAAKKYVSGGGASSRGEAGGHPSISGYMQSILRRMGLG